MIPIIERKKSVLKALDIYNRYRLPRAGLARWRHTGVSYTL